MLSPQVTAPSPSTPYGEGFPASSPIPNGTGDLRTLGVPPPPHLWDYEHPRRLIGGDSPAVCPTLDPVPLPKLPLRRTGSFIAMALGLSHSLPLSQSPSIEGNYSRRRLGLTPSLTAPRGRDSGRLTAPVYPHISGTVGETVLPCPPNTGGFIGSRPPPKSVP